MKPREMGAHRLLRPDDLAAVSNLPIDVLACKSKSLLLVDIVCKGLLDSNLVVEAHLMGSSSDC